MSWTAVAGATGYEVYRNAVNDPATATLIGARSASPLQDVTATAGATYYYWTKATNSCGTSPFSAPDQGSRATSLSITSQPSNTTACVGGNVSFTVAASGTAPLNYQWRRGTANLANGGSISGATTATLTITAVQTTDAGTDYNCVVTNVCGSVTSRSAVLTVGASTAPTDVAASVGTYCTQITVSWTSVAGAMGYEVYRNTTNDPGTAMLIGTPTASPFADTTATPGTEYFYWVKAISSCGTSPFSATGGARIARWDGAAWQPFGAGMSGLVRALTMWDPDGSGPLPAQLIAGGDFATAGGVTANRIARWDGTAWSELGAGMNAQVHALAVLPDGRLIAGGEFTNRIVQWDGAAWQPFGTATNGSVYALMTWDPDGSGPLPAQLVAGGWFFTAGGVTVNNIARWDGAAWQPFGTGMNGSVPALTTWDPDGSGPLPAQLVAGGGFTMAGDALANRIAQWNGTSWSALGTGMNGYVYSLTAWDPDGSGPLTAQLVAGGDFTMAGNSFANRVAQWNSTSWSELGSGMNSWVFALAVLPNGHLIAGGGFTTAGNASANRIARWNGMAWSALGSGMNERIAALAILPNGDPVAAGWFTPPDHGSRANTPTITAQPQNETACLGSDKRFTVFATGTSPLAYQWRRGTTNLVNGGTISGAATATLTITGVQPTDAGTDYNCVVTNLCGNVTSNNASLFVGVPLPPTNVAATDGTSCTEVTVSWTAVAGAAWYEVYRNTTNNPATVTRIGTPSVSPFIDTTAAVGTTFFYWVKAAGFCGSSPLGTADQGSRAPAPSITTQPSNATACVGGNANFTVAVSSTVPLTYRWRRGTTLLVNGGTISGVSSATLTITGVVAGDASTNYNCVVTNACGDVTSNDATLTVGLIPLAPTNVLASDACGLDVRVTWAAVSNTEGYRVYRSTAPDPLTAILIGEPSASPYFDRESDVDTTYYYWVQAVNACGVSPISVWDVGRSTNSRCVIYVRGDAPPGGDGLSWSSAFNSLDSALLVAARSTVEVWVASGTYTTSGGFVVPSACEVYGGFAGTETQREQRDASMHVTTLIGSTTTPTTVVRIENVSGVRLDGFRITGGVGSGSSFAVSRPGGGVRIAAAEAVIANCRIVNNTSSINFPGQWGDLGNGGGAAIGLGSRVVFRNCSFATNSASPLQGGVCSGGNPYWYFGPGYGGGLYVDASHVTLQQCTFEGNVVGGGTGGYSCSGGAVGGGPGGNGGAVYAAGSTLEIHSCIFRSNTGGWGGGGNRDLSGACLPAGAGGDGGAVFVTSGVSTTIANSVFSANSAGSGGLGSPGCGNGPAGAGSAIFGDASTRVINCTFSNNTIGDVVVGVQSISNSILWNNSGSALPTGDVRYSCVQGIAATLGNINTNPRFVDADGPDNVPGNADDDFSLLPASPCIDAGSNSLISATALFDAAGRARFRDDPLTSDTGVGPAPVVDMGAFELQGGAMCVDCNSNAICDTTDLSNGALHDCDGDGRPDECALAGWPRMVAPNPGAGDLFGRAVALFGDVLVVGSPFADLGNLQDAGSVFVYEYRGGGWVRLQQLADPQAQRGDNFGRAVAVFEDWIFVGSPYSDGPTSVTDAGVVLVFHRDPGGGWSLAQRLVAPDPAAGAALGHALAVDGDRFVAGAVVGPGRTDRTGAAYVFRLVDGAWTFEQKLFADDGMAVDGFGVSVGVSGQRVVVGAFGRNLYQGSAYVYHRRGGTWVQQAHLLPADAQPPDVVGESVAIDGDTLVLSARNGSHSGLYQPGASYVYEWDGSQWSLSQKLSAQVPQADAEFGFSSVINGNTIAVGSRWYDGPGGINAGTTYLFTRVAGRWLELSRIDAFTGANGWFGDELALGARIGNHQRLVVAAPWATVNASSNAGAVVELDVGVLDCNANGIPDACELADGRLHDANHNGMPDECERCVADVDDGSGAGTPDGGVTIDDLLYYLVLYTAGDARADLDDGSGTGTPDGGVTIEDLLYFLARYQAGC